MIMPYILKNTLALTQMSVSSACLISVNYTITHLYVQKDLHALSMFIFATLACDKIYKMAFIYEYGDSSILLNTNITYSKWYRVTINTLFCIVPVDGFLLANFITIASTHCFLHHQKGTEGYCGEMNLKTPK